MLLLNKWEIGKYTSVTSMLILKHWKSKKSQVFFTFWVEFLPDPKFQILGVQGMEQKVVIISGLAIDATNIVIDF